MPYIPPEVILEAKKMDLLTYLQNYDPQELVHVSGGEYTTRTHDSLRISNGLWNWCSRGIGGKSALDYLIKVKGVSFLEAVEQITGQAAIQPSVILSQKQKSPKKLLLPGRFPSTENAINYLAKRGIDKDIINYCIHTGRIYESYPRHNVVFVGFNKQGTAKYAAMRGIGTDFIGDANGSDKHYSFNIPAQRESKTLNLFESAIDLLSYGTLQKMDGEDWRRDHLVSLAGVYQPKKEIAKSKVPAALTQFLTDYPQVKRVVLRLDNDPIGRLAATAIKTVLPKEYEVSISLSPKGKDYNDFLCMELGLPMTPKRDKPKER